MQATPTGGHVSQEASTDVAGCTSVRSEAQLPELAKMPGGEQEALIAHHESGDQRGDDESRYYAARRRTGDFLSSKAGHYTVILMVAADVGGIFASFIIDQYICEHECCQRLARYQNLRDAKDALGVLSLVFSCLFMVELLASVWSFGLPYDGPSAP